MFPTPLGGVKRICWLAGKSADAAGAIPASPEQTPSLPVSSPPVPPPPSKPPPRELFIRLGLVWVVVAIYGQTLGAGFIAFDDPGYVYDNAHVRAGLSLAGLRWAFSSFQQSNWHPLTWLSLQLDAQLYGLHAGGFHLTNLLLHAANTLLLFGWLRRTTGALWPAALVALFFAAHPLHVESVAWVTERKDVLSTCFFCLTLLAYGRYVEGGPRRGRWYALAVGLYGLSLLAKPMLVTLPLLLLLLDGWPLARFTRATWWARAGALLLEKLPFGVLAAASCVVTFLAQRTQAVVALEALPLRFRLASAALGVGTYLQKTFWPLGLGVFYPYWHQVAWWQPLGWAVGLAALTALVLWGGRAQPFLAVGWLWFVGTLVPVLGLVQVGSQAVADRYTYVPHIGLFVALAWSGQAAWRRWPPARKWLSGGAVAAAAACVGLSIRQASYWQDGVTLFEHTLAVSTQPSARLYGLYGDALMRSGREAEAIRAYEQSWQIGDEGRTQAAVMRLSALCFNEGRWSEVIGLLEPLSHQADADKELLNTLAAALLRSGQTDRAGALYRRCAEQYPAYAQSHFGLAECLRLRGDVPGACAEYEAGLAQQEERLSALTYLAWVYAHLDDPAAHERSLTLARRAVEIGRRQDIASFNALAAAEASTSHWPQAIVAARNALALANQSGTPAGVAELSRVRLASYEQGRLP